MVWCFVVDISVQLTAEMGGSFGETEWSLIIDNKRSEMLLSNCDQFHQVKHWKSLITDILSVALESNDCTWILEQMERENAQLFCSTCLVGLYLGDFYTTFCQPNKEVTGELDAENRNYLAIQTLLELRSCYRRLDDMTAYSKCVPQSLHAKQLEPLALQHYFDEFVRYQSIQIKKIDIVVEGHHDDCISRMEEHSQVFDVHVTQNGPIIQVMKNELIIFVPICILIYAFKLICRMIL